MSLQVWLPLNGSLENQGLSDVTVVNSGASVVSGGKVGKCYQFDGSDDYISLTGDILYQVFQGGSKPFSMAFWVYHADASRAIIFGDYQLSGAINFNVELTTGHIVRLYWNSSPDLASGEAIVTQGAWTHVTITYSGIALNFYIDGVLKYTWTNTLSTKNKTSGSYYLGRDSRTGTTVLNGRLNDVRIYDHCLSPMEIKELSKGLILHYKLDRGGWGNPNLLLNSHVSVNTSSYNMHDYYFVSGQAPVEGNTYTIQIKGQLGEGKTYFGPYNSGGSVSEIELRPSSQKNGVYTGTFTWRTSSASNTFLRIYHMYYSVSVNSTIEWVKLEEGSVATPWCPNAADTLGIALGVDNGIEYDCSGYKRNGLQNALTYSTDTARYDISSTFNGSSSYIKAEDTTWMADRMEALTINVWAKASSWSANAHIFSCTEGGGFNCEAGNSGYWRFPVNVYTSATSSSYAYKYDSTELKYSDLPTDEWVMLTWIYELTGTKTYINGELHHTYSNVSYGIHFNTSARLFLGCEASRANPTGPYFPGILSDFRMYATALSADDIARLYHTSGYIDNAGNIYTGEFKEVGA